LARSDRRVEVRFASVSASLCATVESTKIGVALAQLIRNACEFADARSASGAAIEVQFFEQDQLDLSAWQVLFTLKPPSSWVAIVVRNNGEMDREVRDSIGRPYFSTKGEGSGIGLAVVQGALRSNRGQLLIRVQGGYTEFAMVLPRTETTRETARPILT
jgi:signal transduction histidine kinase